MENELLRLQQQAAELENVINNEIGKRADNKIATVYATDLAELWENATEVAAAFCSRYKLQINVDEDTKTLGFVAENDPLQLIGNTPDFDREFRVFQQILAITCVNVPLSEGIAITLLEKLDDPDY